MKTRDRLIQRLRQLEATEGKWTRRSLAEDLGLNPQNVQMHLERMLRDGVVKRGSRRVVIPDTLVLAS